jgi:hypothetical protein
VLPLSNDDNISNLSSVELVDSKDGNDQADEMDVVDASSSNPIKPKDLSVKKPSSQYGMYSLSNPEGYRRGGTTKRPPRAVSPTFSSSSFDCHYSFQTKESESLRNIVRALSGRLQMTEDAIAKELTDKLEITKTVSRTSLSLRSLSSFFLP